MHWQSLLAGLALLVVAVAAGGAAVGLAGLLATPTVAATLVLVAVLLLVTVFAAARSRPRLSTPYW